MGVVARPIAVVHQVENTQGSGPARAVGERLSRCYAHPPRLQGFLDGSRDWTRQEARRAYGFDDIAIVPSRRTRDPDDIDISWKLGPYQFELPMLASAMDGVVSPRTAGSSASSVVWRYSISRASSRVMRTPRSN